MEPLDQEVAEALRDGSPPRGPARILVLASDEQCRRSILAAINKDHQCTCAAGLEEARQFVSRSSYDLVVVNPDLHDGNGLEVVEMLSRKTPAAKAIVLSSRAGADVVIEAMRRGAADFLTTSTALSELSQRIERAIVQSRSEQQRDEKLSKLKRVCKKLNTARLEVSQQLDTLCKDLVNSYQDTAEQISEATMATEFRTLIRQELDLEDLLRTTLEYMLTKTGPTNAAVFLPNNGKDFALGAYVNYDCPRESVAVLLEHLCQAICPQMCEETELVSFDDAEEFAQWIGYDASFLADSQVIALSCRHKGECLAVLVLFRSQSEPYDANLASTMEVLRPIFAEQINHIVKIHHRLRPCWPKDAADAEDEYDYDCDDDLGLGGMAA
jgi:DNA-binding response OmpR family regulator